MRVEEGGREGGGGGGRGADTELKTKNPHVNVGNDGGIFGHCSCESTGCNLFQTAVEFCQVPRH